jgi:hypothetical protein
MARLATNMQRLELDFVRRPPAAPAAGPLLLALAAAFTANLMLNWSETRAAVREKETRIAALMRISGVERAPGVPARVGAGAGRTPGTSVQPSADELAAAAETVRRISLSWDGLFAALEAASSDKIALLGVEPDPKSRTVLITGEGKDYAAALAYVVELRRAGALARVHLVHHETKRDDPQKAVAFSIAASWSDKPK